MVLAKMGWLRHVLTSLSVIIFVLGCAIIGYMAWVLASSVTVSKFLDGTMIFTYSLVTLGFVLFFSGLIGWVGGASESPCLVRLFLFTVILSLIAEIGGIITLNAFKAEYNDILATGWVEVNQGTRNIIQNKLECCGWDGSKDFAYNNEPIDESCYEEVSLGNSGILARKDIDEVPTKKMKSSGCGPKLSEWVIDNKITWVTTMAILAALQVMCVGIAVYILSRVKRLKKFAKLRTLSKRHLYDSSSASSSDGGSREFRHRI